MKTTASGSAFLITLGWIPLLCFTAVGSTASFAERFYCTGVYACLSEKPESCSSDMCRADTGITYDSDFCDVFRELHSRGVGPESSRGRRVYSLLSQKHRVTYEIAGELPIAAKVLAYLMDHIPFAAQLINAYEGTSYSARYLDEKGKRFRGTNGDTVSGTFITVEQNSDKTETVYFGTGTTKLLMWRLWGAGVIFFEYQSLDAGHITYRVRCMVSPGSSFVSSIMKFVLFRKLVNGMLRDIITSIHRATQEFAAGNREPLAAHAGFMNPEGRRGIKEFEQIVNRHTAR